MYYIWLEKDNFICIEIFFIAQHVLFLSDCIMFTGKVSTPSLLDVVLPKYQSDRSAVPAKKSCDYCQRGIPFTCDVCSLFQGGI